MGGGKTPTTPKTGGYELEIDGVKYWQPECNCKGTGHICYLRMMPQLINVPLDKILKANFGGSGVLPAHSNQAITTAKEEMEEL